MRVALGAPAGRGHLSRCLALAGALRRLGHEVEFVAASPSDAAVDDLRQQEFALHAVEPASECRDPEAEAPSEAQAEDAARTFEVLRAFDPEVVVCDDYGLALAWDTAASRWAPMTAAIEDFPHRRRGAHLVVDQVGLRKEDPATEHQRLLAGPRYILLREDVAAQRERGPTRGSSPGTVVAFLGAGQASVRGWSQLIPSLTELAKAGRPVRIVGVPDAARGGLPANLSTTSPDLSVAELFAGAELMVCSAGVTALEAAALGIPSALVQVATNQRGTAELLARCGAAEDLGPSEELTPDAIGDRIAWMLADPAARDAMSAAGRRLIDGHGALRVAMALCGPGDRGIDVRPARQGDEDLYHDWFMDAATRRSAGDPSPVSIEAHRRWFRERLASSGSMLQVASVEGLPIGQVRLDRSEVGWRLDYSLDHAVRGWRLAAPMLDHALAEVLQSGETVRAEARAENAASRRTLERVGFRPARPTDRMPERDGFVSYSYVVP